MSELAAARIAFRDRQPAMAFRCQVGADSGAQCNGAVRISPVEAQGGCSRCGTVHGRNLKPGPPA